MWAWGSVPKAPRPAWGPAGSLCSPALSPASSSIFHLDAPCLAGTTARLTAAKASEEKQTKLRSAQGLAGYTESPCRAGIQKPCDFRLGVQGGALGEGFGDRFGGVDRRAGAMIERLPIQGPRPERPGVGGHVRLGALGGDPHFGSNSSCFAKCCRPFSLPHAASGVSTGVVGVASQRRAPRAAPRVHSPPR